MLSNMITTVNMKGDQKKIFLCMGHKWPPLGRQASPGPFRPPEASPKSIRPPQKPPQEKSWGRFLGPNMRLTPLIWSTFDQNNAY